MAEVAVVARMVVEAVGSTAAEVAAVARMVVVAVVVALTVAVAITNSNIL